MGWQDDPEVGAGDEEVKTIRGRPYIEPNDLQRRAGIRKNRFKDENFAGNVGRGFLDLGEDAGRGATLLATDLGASPDVANAAGFAADAGTVLMPTGPTGRAAASASKPLLDPAAKFVMQSALKPTSKSLVNGDAATAIDVMLTEGVPATAAGGAKLRILISKLKGEVAEMISQSPANVNLAHAYKELQGTLDEVGKKGIGAPADREAVLKAWDEFKNHPLFDKFREVSEEVPIQVADTVKRALQQSVDYTTPVRSAVDQAKMAAASGLRKGMEAAEGAIGPINAKLSEYITALRQIEPRAAQAANKDLGGLVPLANSAEQAMLMLADRNPWLKSYIARVLYGGQLPSAAARTATVGAETLDRN